jgi:hypothetical protein
MRILLFCWALPLMWSCQSPKNQAGARETAQVAEANPPAPGFNAAGSDERAIAIADEVMLAMGGRQAWDQTRYIAWNFFGRRHLLWDKHAGRARIEIPEQSAVYLVDLNTLEGKVKKSEELVTHPDSLTKFLEQAKSTWINDAYWLFMPFKLKDSGVTLKYMGEMNTQAGKAADVLQLTFEAVGDTPENKYLVYVDKESRLVSQWDFFRRYDDEKPFFSSPWEDYRRYGGILLSGGRGGRQLSDIEVLDEVSETVFTQF